MENKNQEISEREHFDELYKQYDENYNYNDPFTQYKAERRIATIVQYISTINTKSIIEIGCGTGEYTRLLAKNFPQSQIYAFDISPNMIKTARKKCEMYSNASFFVASVYSLPYQYCFDLTCGFYIMHHLNLSQAFRSIDKTVSNNGYISFFEPNLLNPIVFIIKNSRWIKQRVGDTPTEYAINPLVIDNIFIGYRKLHLETNEFTPLISNFSLNLMLSIDKVTQFFGRLPMINLLGGTVEFIYQKIMQTKK
jgi:ubiquinone/menaquinone biosynthesis C-methylase UbiE